MNHDKALTKLNRVAGQVEGVKKMIADQRYCPEILAQLRAVRSALRGIEADILETHLQSCVAAAMIGDDADEKSRKITEVKELFKRYDD